MGRNGVTAYHPPLQSRYTGCLARFPRRMDSTALVRSPITATNLTSFPTTVIASPRVADLTLVSRSPSCSLQYNRSLMG
jgi:hypothetical protein